MFDCLNDNSEEILELYNKFAFIDSLDELADVLEINPLFEEEYYLLLSIINDVEYIVIDNRQLLKENLNYIESIVINFCRLICDKQDLCSSNYEKEYKEFISFYNAKQEQFYNSLPAIGEDYEDAINKITNVLW